MNQQVLYTTDIHYKILKSHDIMECHQCQNVTIYLYTDITSLLLTTSHVFINLPNLYRHFIRIEILFG